MSGQRGGAAPARRRANPLLRSALGAACSCLLACAPAQGTIGAIIGQSSDGRLFLREVPPNLAADKAGLREDDQILLIDGRDVRTLSAEQIHLALSGEVNEPVKLTILRNEEVIRVTLKRTPAKKLGPPRSP